MSQTPNPEGCDDCGIYFAAGDEWYQGQVGRVFGEGPDAGPRFVTVNLCRACVQGWVSRLHGKAAQEFAAIEREAMRSSD